MRITLDDIISRYEACMRPIAWADDPHDSRYKRATVGVWEVRAGPCNMAYTQESGSGRVGASLLYRAEVLESSYDPHVPDRAHYRWATDGFNALEAATLAATGVVFRQAFEALMRDLMRLSLQEPEQIVVGG